MNIAGVEVVHWNPRKYRVPRTGLRFGARKNNFGDLLGPLIVRRLRERTFADVTSNSVHARDDAGNIGSYSKGKRLLSVGSIMHFATDHDVVWGTGVNGKISLTEHRFSQLDIRSVRGPMTAEWLWKNKGLEVPEVFGDPGLLIGALYPELHLAKKTRKLTVIPNLNEQDKFKNHPGFVSPTAPVEQVLKAIAQSELVVGSSLHAIVVSDALNIPAFLVRSEAEPEFKYKDYFLGSGRTDTRTYSDLESAEKAGNAISRSEDYSPLAKWSSDSLIEAFPIDLWHGVGEVFENDRATGRGF